MGKLKKANRRLQRERELHGWSQAKLAEKIGTTVKRVSMWECGDATPGRYYQELLIQLFGKNAQELGFLDDKDRNENKNSDQEDSHVPVIPTQETHIAQFGVSDLAVLSQPIQLYTSDEVPVSITVQIREHILPSLFHENRPFALVDKQLSGTAYSSCEDTALPEEQPGSEALKRRDFLYETGQVAIGMMSVDVLEHFYRALKKPSTIDDQLLNYLQMYIEGYWRDRHSAVIAFTHLFDHVTEYFQKVTHLLHGPMLPQQRIQLCIIASKTAQLAGLLLFDTGNFRESRQFHQAAIAAAKEGDNRALQAMAWARMSFTWTYSNNSSEALRSIEQARLLATGSTNKTAQAYLAAVEAEVQANLGDATACFKALDQAESLVGQQSTVEDSHWLHFDQSHLAGYKGICFRQLYRQGDSRTASFLLEGQHALKDALVQLAPSVIQRRPILLIDLASTYVLQGNIEAACEYAAQAILLIDQIKSQANSRRLLKLRQALKPWQETQYVKNLDGQMAQYRFFTPLFLHPFDSEEMS